MKDKLVVLGVVVALILGGVALTKEKTITIDKNTDPKELAGVFSYLPTPEINLGGLRLVGMEKALATGTSTVCAIQSPSATSTLVSAGVRFGLASTSAVSFDLTNASTQYASSTKQIGTHNYIGASYQAMIVASTTDNDATFAPSQWFVAKFYDANNGVGNASTGRCWATWATPQ